MTRQQSNSLRMVEPSVVEPAGGVRHEDRGPARSGGGGGPVPPDNQPGHHPDHDQDRPDPDAFVERFSHAGERTESGQEAGPEAGADPGEDTGDAPAPATEPAIGAAGDRREPDDADLVEVPSMPLPVAAAITVVLPPLDRLRSCAAKPLRMLADLLDPAPDED